MTGDLLARMARRIMRPLTFELIAAPAIADLQAEAALVSRVRIAAVYVGVCGVLLRAMAYDIRHDLLIASAPSTLRAVWRPAALWAAAIVAAVSTAALAGEPWTRLGDDGARAVITQTLIVAILMGLLWTTVPAALLLTRQGTPRRVVATIACVGALLTATVSVVTRESLSAVHEYAEAARWRARFDPDQTRPLGTVVSAVVQSSMAASARREGIAGWEPVYRWWAVQAGVSVFALAIIGATLARSSSWMLAGRLAALPVAWAALVRLMLEARRGADWSPIAEGWGSVAVMFVIAFVQVAWTRWLSVSATSSR